MAAPLILVMAAAAALGGVYDGAQTAYLQCLAMEVDAAVVHRIDSDSFARGVPQVCQDETATWRRMSVTAMIGQGLDGASPVAANRRFDAADRANRAQMIATFEEKMRLRRGPSRIAGLAANRAQQD